MSCSEWEERFWSKVRRGPGCWEWTATRTDRGYGMFSLHGSTRRAHRVSYKLAHGQYPEHLCVLHTCDNPPCVNPSHLYLGTHTDNMRDMVTKGRNVPLYGERNGFAKLSADDVRGIRDADAPQHELAREYGVSKSAISKIRKGRNWAQVGGPRTHGPRNRKLSALDARAIFLSGEAHSALATRYGVDSSLISQIKRRKAWAHTTRGCHE